MHAIGEFSVKLVATIFFACSVKVIATNSIEPIRTGEQQLPATEKHSIEVVILFLYAE